MSLAEKSNGILETHVHWEEIEKEMQEAFGTSATFGPNKSVKNIGEQKGFMSRISLIHPDWQNKSEGLPESFIAKISTALSIVEVCTTEKTAQDSSVILKLLQLCWKLHNMEVETYKIMEKYSEGRIPLPKIYASRKFTDENQTKGYILMEFFPDLAPCHIVDNISINSMKKVLRSIAIWQGIGMKMTKEERKIFDCVVSLESMADLFDAENVKQFRAGLNNFCGEEHVGTVDRYYDLMLKMFTGDYYHKLASLPDKLGYMKVFCHGDLASTNILWVKANNDFDIKAHIDFQTGTFCSPGSDFARVFCSCLSESDRRNHYKELLSTFYGYLSEEVEELPYTLEQLEKSYLHFLPHGAFAAVGLIDSIYKFIQTERPELTQINKNAVVKKCVALMEDAVTCYDEHPLD